MTAHEETSLFWKTLQDESRRVDRLIIQVDKLQTQVNRLEGTIEALLKLINKGQL